VASDYFGHRNHRYREMLAAGVNVCLGTDSILCQPAGEPQPLGILAQMRHLYRRDQADPEMLLKMATIHGIRGLGFDREHGLLNATLKSGAPAKLLAVRIDPADSTDPLTQALGNNYPGAPVVTLEFLR
jgi:cytosine/adenosine deaminase-related metal-dependent hydrolase